jgi:hypothetical protein
MRSSAGDTSSSSSSFFGVCDMAHEVRAKPADKRIQTRRLDAAGEFTKDIGFPPQG